MVSRQWNPVIQLVKNSMPPFEISLSEGHLTTTLPEPFILSEPQFTIIVDTSGKTLDASAYESAILISKTKAILKKDRFETREYDWAAVPDFKVTTADLLDWLTAHKSVILWSIFSTLALGVLPLMWLFFIPVIFFLALVLLLPAKIFGTSLRYGQTLSIAYYAVTLPTIAQTVLLMYGLAKGPTFWAIYLVWAVIGVAVCKGVAEPAASGSPAPPPPSTVS